MAKKSATTVLGPIKPNDLGVTLIHEHLMIDMACYWVKPNESSEKSISNAPISLEIFGRLRRDPYLIRDNLVLSNQKSAIEELGGFRKMGGKTLVDMSNIGLGRNPIALRKISTLTGVNVIAGCGYYVDISRPRELAKMTADELASVMIRDLTVGIDGTDVKAGIIGEIGISGATVTKEEVKILKGVAKAHLETGAPISIHQPTLRERSTKEGIEAVNILKDEGVRPDRITMSHSDEKDIDVEKKLLDTGVFINFDHLGLEFYWDSLGVRFLSDAERLDKLIELVESGYISQIMLSQDVCMKTQLKKYGGFGYDHLLTNILPMLQRAGVDVEQFKTMMEENPKRFLVF